VVILAVLAVAGIGWWIEDRALHLSHASSYPQRVRAVGPGTVTLPPATSSRLLGRYRLEWRGGTALLSEVLRDDRHGVVRVMTEPQGTPLHAGTRTRMTDVYRGDPRSALGVAYDELRLPSPLGPMPAWLVPGTRSTWAIMVHGYGGSREDGLYLLPALHRLGVPSLFVTYRNDAGAPKGPGGLVHLGQTEWRDLEPAMDYAQGHGATGVVLIGGSMGGTIVAEYVRHSPHAGLVRGLVLDAPGLDFGTDLRAGARTHGLRGPFNWLLIGVARWAMQLQGGIDFGELNQIAHARDFHLPILLYQGDRDELAPVSGADAFARARPDVVTYVRVPGAAHLEAWNVDPGRCEASFADFLARTGSITS